MGRVSLSSMEDAKLFPDLSSGPVTYLISVFFEDFRGCSFSFTEQFS